MNQEISCINMRCAKLFEFEFDDQHACSVILYISTFKQGTEFPEIRIF